MVTLSNVNEPLLYIVAPLFSDSFVFPPFTNLTLVIATVAPGFILNTLLIF
ncbi:MAG: hypothetical protein LBT66_07320 [Methanobrevibacter sp.]|nr:hypothetical protein [Candidatus Methanovirga meridionalis]